MVDLNSSLVGKPKSKRIFYFDALRALAIICVIIIHCASFTKGFFISKPIYSFHGISWLFHDFLDVCCCLGVVLFLMLAGALSLGRNWSIKSFLGRRIPRIVLPFLFWGAVLSAIIAFLYWFYPNGPLSFNEYAISRMTELSAIGLVSYLKFLYSYYTAKAFTSFAYWFFWMILGTYLIMPIFNKWILHSDLNELEYFLFFWLITCIFDFTLGYEFPIKLTYFVSPIGLVVLGYYLRYTERKILNNPYFDLFLIIVACIIQILISYHFSTPKEFYILDRYSIFNAIEVTGVFLLFKNIGKFNISINFFNNPEGIFHRIVFLLAKNSYGIYLIQVFVIRILYDNFNKLHLYNYTFPFFVISLIILSTIVSLIIIDLLGRVPYLGKIVGSK